MFTRFPCPPILTHFANLRDRCQHAKVLYSLPELLLLALAGTIAGAGDFVEITLWGQQNQAFLRRLLPCENGIPSHDMTRAPSSLHSKVASRVT